MRTHHYAPLTLLVCLLLIILSSCGAPGASVETAPTQQQPQATDSPPPRPSTTGATDVSKQPMASTSPQAGSVSAQSAAEASSAQGDAGDDTPMEWPAELMGDVPPVSGASITSIDKASDIWGEDAPDYIIVVSLKGMSKEACGAYVAQLKALGFANGVSEENDSSIRFSGSIDEKSEAAAFYFNYSKNTGYVSFNPRS